MYGIIMTAHSKYASGVYSGLKLVCGELENIRVVDYLESQGYEELDANLKEAYKEMKRFEKVIFITDLLGGTPFSRSVLNFGANENVKVLAGLNFPLLYAATMTDTGDMEKDIEEILQAGKEGITVYKQVETKIEEEEDGI